MRFIICILQFCVPAEGGWPRCRGGFANLPYLAHKPGYARTWDTRCRKPFRRLEVAPHLDWARKGHAQAVSHHASSILCTASCIVHAPVVLICPSLSVPSNQAPKSDYGVCHVSTLRNPHPWAS